MARLEGQGHTGLHDCPRPRSDARRRARRKTDRPHVTADPVGRGHCDPRSLMNAEQVQPNMPRALHKKSWAVIDRPYSLACATVRALYERPRCIFCAKPMQSINYARRSSFAHEEHQSGPTLVSYRLTHIIRDPRSSVTV